MIYVTKDQLNILLSECQEWVKNGVSIDYLSEVLLHLADKYNGEVFAVVVEAVELNELGYKEETIERLEEAINCLEVGKEKKVV
ncbi:hypothetical protein [Halalkalibacter alkalisediminis]|uniref:CopG family transcriptional regulator n=1 Tax=Halalkalibacter alkalisediminis TaxID=935616 RepID=A0ABV6NJ90_9BACI